MKTTVSPAPSARHLVPCCRAGQCLSYGRVRPEFVLSSVPERRTVGSLLQPLGAGVVGLKSSEKNKNRAPSVGRCNALFAGAHYYSSYGPEPRPETFKDEDVEEELHTVNTAIKANALIFVAKLVVFVLSGSSAMLAEAVHSLVDIANQMLLRISVTKAQKGPTALYPYGFARDRFIWPLISAVGIFCCGAGVSVVHGLQGLFEVREVGHVGWGLIVIGVSAVLEGYSLHVAVKSLMKRAKASGLSFMQYLRTGADPASVAVMMEDGAAVTGLAIAGASMALMKWTGNAMWDSAGSILIGVLLGGVAMTLIQRNRSMLIGRAMPAEDTAKILSHLGRDPVVRSIYDTKTEELGPGLFRFKAEIAFSGERVAERALSRCGREAWHARVVRAADDPRQLDAVLRAYGGMVVNSIGAEVDRIEAEIQAINPGVRYVDLETDVGRQRRAGVASSSLASVAGDYTDVCAAAVTLTLEEQEAWGSDRPAAGPTVPVPLQEGLQNGLAVANGTAAAAVAAAGRQGDQSGGS